MFSCWRSSISAVIGVKVGRMRPVGVDTHPILPDPLSHCGGLWTDKEVWGYGFAPTCKLWAARMQQMCIFYLWHWEILDLRPFYSARQAQINLRGCVKNSSKRASIFASLDSQWSTMMCCWKFPPWESVAECILSARTCHEIERSSWHSVCQWIFHGLMVERKLMSYLSYAETRN